MVDARLAPRSGLLRRSPAPRAGGPDGMEAEAASLGGGTLEERAENVVDVLGAAHPDEDDVDAGDSEEGAERPLRRRTLADVPEGRGQMGGQAGDPRGLAIRAPAERAKNVPGERG